MTQSPDPILTASLYCQDHLDGAIHNVVAPVLERLRAELPDERWMAWWVRYGRGGEHLKVRLHGPAEHRAAAKDALAAAAEAFFAGLPAPDPAAERIDRRALPPIDAEDRAPEPYPDRSLVWTEYSRSPVLLGTLFLDEDDYVARLTTCLARAADVSLGAEPGPDGAIPGAARQRTLLKAAIAALAGADFEPGGRALYLAYHRDWLLRFAAPGKAQEAQLRATFDARVEGMAAAVEQVRGVATAGWSAEAADGGDAPQDRLRDAVAELCAYLAPRRHDPASIGDPFAAEAAFPGVFKTLHGAANQLGLNMPNEAFLYHLLLAAVADGAVAEPVAAESRG